MDVKERVTCCRLITKIERDPAFAAKLGLQGLMVNNMKKKEKKNYGIQPTCKGIVRQIWH